MALVEPSLGSGIVRTVRIVDPPTPSELQRRKEAGCLPYPSRLAYRLIVIPTSESDSAFVSYEDYPGTKGTGRANARDQYRQARYGELLRSHHVPIVPFMTFPNQKEQEQYRGSMGKAGGIPSAEELLAYRRRLRFKMRDEDYVMCWGFHPSPGQYYYKPGHGINVMPRPIVQLQRMYTRDVEPAPACSIAVSEEKLTIAPI
ncbi:uncharacterized protein TM35_000361270 [Trypanosoma theileri]|uniref:Uncharacterized protein n=1 Tax=Trypanosoma theileri TaxID=67003 RepID=A0A1X0NKU3_9TRYP|nr:uncharacterized protein TM35_000361270 [Trypanosoma theileri]ORC85267.1 hypothetical protein TM35_000361270 [Trypanosoma theileri]